jgi:phage gp36-like protein
MAYSSLSDIALTLPSLDIAQLTDDTGGLTINAACVTEVVSVADAIIDSMVRGRYSVPFLTVPAEIRDASRGLAIAGLFERRPTMTAGVPEPVKEKKAEIIDWLKGVRDGKNILNTGTASSLSAGFFKSNKDEDSKTFTSDILDTYA